MGFNGDIFIMLTFPKYKLMYAFPLLALSIIIIFFGIEIQMKKKITDASIIPQSPNIKSPIFSSERSKKTNANQVKETFSLQNELMEEDNQTSNISPSLDFEGIPVAWILRVNEFKDKKTAIELSKKLISNGYRAFVKESTNSGVVVSHVYIGPKISKKKLLKEKESLYKKYGLDSQLIKFKP